MKKGDLVKMRYGPKYPGMPYQDRHGLVILIAKDRPRNVLLRLREGFLVVVPWGNCKPIR